MTDQPPPLDLSGDDDLFALPPAKQPRGPHTGRDHPDTSFKAADKVTPAVGTIRRQVEAFWYAKGEAGAIDDDMIETLAGEDRAGDRSYRPRRRELSDANIILDSGRRAENRNGNDCVVWVHRDFAVNPPPVMDRPAKAKPPPTPDLKAAFATLDLWHNAMKQEGRLVQGLREAIDTVRRAAT